jgi:hypothetical protein
MERMAVDRLHVHQIYNILSDVNLGITETSEMSIYNSVSTPCTKHAIQRWRYNDKQLQHYNDRFGNSFGVTMTDSVRVLLGMIRQKHTFKYVMMIITSCSSINESWATSSINTLFP